MIKDESHSAFETLLQDTCETDSYVRDRVKNVLTNYEINGDSYHVPTIEDIVDKLVNKLEKNCENIN